VLKRDRDLDERIAEALAEDQIVREEREVGDL